MIDNVTSRAGLINLNSLVWNQFAAPVYRDLLRHAWHCTDPDYSTSELSAGVTGKRKFSEIQFEFDTSTRFEFKCTEYAFIKCSHCGKHMCITWREAVSTSSMIQCTTKIRVLIQLLVLHTLIQAHQIQIQMKPITMIFVNEDQARPENTNFRPLYFVNCSFYEHHISCVEYA